MQVSKIDHLKEWLEHNEKTRSNTMPDSHSRRLYFEKIAKQKRREIYQLQNPSWRSQEQLNNQNNK